MTKIEAFGLSDVGRKRKHNEDSFASDPEEGLFIVADGMGGHSAGEVASKMAVEAVQGLWPPVAPRKGPPAGAPMRPNARSALQQAVHPHLPYAAISRP